MAGQTVMQPAV